MKKAATRTTHTGLAVRWVPVVSTDGRTRMEMRWSAPAALRKRPTG
jgi:hypothetical protein